VKVYAKLAAKAGVISAEELQLIKVVSGYGKQEGKRVDERRPVTRVGYKKATRVRLAPTQAKKLKSQPDTPQGRRDALLMCLLLDHGLRVGEVVRLQVADFDLERGELRFYRPKVDIEQAHQLSGDTWRVARAYFRLDALKNGRVLLGSRKNGRLTKKPLSIRAIKKRVAFIGRKNHAAHRPDPGIIWGDLAQGYLRRQLRIQSQLWNDPGQFRSLVVVEFGRILKAQLLGVKIQRPFQVAHIN
jgi:integrase